MISMTAKQLNAEQFSEYPPQARRIASEHISLLRDLPLSFLPLLLRELIAYDWKFPAERKELDNQLAYLESLSPEQLSQIMRPFGQLQLPSDLEVVDWIHAPAQFSERLTAHLWATHQIDAFRTASIEYVHKLNSVTGPQPLPTARMGVVVIGQGVGQNDRPLFRKLRRHGVYFKNVVPDEGVRILLEAVAARAKSHPIPFAHWYIDGGKTADSYAGLSCVSYGSLDSVRALLMTKMRNVMQSGAGPEALRSLLAQMRPEELGMDGTGDHAVMNRFQISLLTEGSGTQIFSTSFVQWSAREVLRRAQPLTLLARFAPRQHEQSMRELLAGTQQQPVPDPEGSLIDADMGAYYTWINQQRLSDAERSSFLVWFEDHNAALAIGPSLARGTESESPADMSQLLARLA